MPTSLVNLDALIKREEFTITSVGTLPTISPNQTTLKIDDLEPDRVWPILLRKPDFQRETANWDAGRVATLIESFAKGDLIPAIILWKADSGNIFVIDGSHRLSALVAWVRDDYGDKQISRQFFENYIPPEQIKAAERTRKFVKGLVGTYEELKAALRNQENSSPEQVHLAKTVFGTSIQLQWVPGNADRAQTSYFKINRQAVKIDPTELSIIECRRKPNALATRSLIRAGTGHKYWSSFPDTAKINIEKVSREIYDTLFKPPIETPIRTLDLPIGGQGYSGESVKMVFDLVNLLNNVTPDMWGEQHKTKDNKTSRKSLLNDEDGSQTLQYLEEVKKVVTLIGSNGKKSLGLHPIVYFYGITGRFLPMTFLAVAAFVKELESKNAFIKFTEVRSQFEEFLVEHRNFVNQIAHQVYGGNKRVEATLLMYKVLFDELTKKTPTKNIIEKMRSHIQLKFLQEIVPENVHYGKDFSDDTKSAVFLRKAIDKSIICSICHTRIHFRSFTYDHKERKQDGGLGTPDNAQLMHPFCNTGYKERLHAQEGKT